MYEKSTTSINSIVEFDDCLTHEGIEDICESRDASNIFYLHMIEFCGIVHWHVVHMVRVIHLNKKVEGLNIDKAIKRYIFSFLHVEHIVQFAEVVMMTY